MEGQHWRERAVGVAGQACQGEVGGRDSAGGGQSEQLPRLESCCSWAFHGVEAGSGYNWSSLDFDTKSCAGCWNIGG